MRRVVSFAIAFMLLLPTSCNGGDAGQDGEGTAPTAPTGATGATEPTGPAPTASGPTGVVTGPAEADPLVAGELEPGTYIFDGFGESLTLTVGAGWEALVPGEPSNRETALGLIVALFHADHPAANIAFIQSSRVIDPERDWDEEGNLIPMPDDLLGWFAGHPMHQAEERSTTTIAGRDAETLNLVVADVPRNGWPSCGGQCVIWIPVFVEHEDGPVTTEDLIFGGGLDERDRMIVLEVGGQQLLIDIGAGGQAAFDAFLPLAEEVLASLEIG